MILFLALFDAAVHQVTSRGARSTVDEHSFQVERCRWSKTAERIEQMEKMSFSRLTLQQVRDKQRGFGEQFSVGERPQHAENTCTGAYCECRPTIRLLVGRAAPVLFIVVRVMLPEILSSTSETNVSPRTCANGDDDVLSDTGAFCG